MNRKHIAKALIMTAAVLLLVFIAGCASAPAEKQEARIQLPARNATLESTGALVFESPNIGWWERTEDRITWDVEVEIGGTYMVSLVASCDPEFPGSTVDVTINGQTVQTTIPSTGGWEYYRILEVATVNLSPGSYELLVQASNVHNRFVANLSEVILDLQ
ncbi:carbohydrate-binding protein [Spirochaeta dissipatitropha]